MEILGAWYLLLGEMDRDKENIDLKPADLILEV